MALSAPQMAMMSRLLDEALPLDEAGRRRWLSLLAPDSLEIAHHLRDALLPQTANESGKPLTMPKIGACSDQSGATTGGLRTGDRVGPYELLEPIGSGGMAEVWLARRADGAFMREVALKLPLRLRARRDLEPRFVRERDILARLNHPHIAKLYDAGFADDGQPYLALEYIAGTPLTLYCDERRLPVRARLELFRQVLDAVHYAHSHLVIHRDLKPSNILVTEEGKVQLLDFGIAKLLSGGEARETELTQLWGRALTPGYAAPEQIAGAPITTAADVYALGVMLYEVLTGVPPYRLKRPSRGALEDAILDTEPALPSRAAHTQETAASRDMSARKLAGYLKGDLDAITAKALKKSPSERYATADAFGEDIQRFLTGQPVVAQPDQIVYRALKFTRRHWIAISFASVLVATLAGGLAATSYEARIAAEERDVAIRAAVRSEQVTRYLESLFDLVSPDRTGGKPIDARTLVDAGQAQIAADLGDQPLLRERLLAAVGELDCKIGRSDQCQKNLEEAIKIHSGQPGVADPRTLAQLQFQLATAYNLTARSDEAIALLRKAQPVIERQADAQQIAAMWYQLGLAQRWKQQLPQAQVSLERARALLQDSQGADTLKSIDVLGQLAITYSLQRRGRDALDLASKRLDLVRSGMGTADLRYFDALNDYAEVVNGLGEFATAEGAWQQVVQGYGDFLGRTSDKTIDAEMSLADSFFRQNKLRESIRWFRRTVEDYRQQGNLDKIEYASALGGLAQVLLLYGDYRAAEAAAREGYAVSQKIGGPTAADIAIARLKWAHTLVAMGDTRHALELLQPEIPEGAAQGFKAARLVWIGDCYREMGELARAQDSYDQALEFWRSINRTQGLSISLTYEAKATVVAQQQRYQEAAALYRMALEGYMAGGYVADGPSIAALKIELADSLAELGQGNEARALLAASGSIAERELAPTHKVRVLLERLQAKLHPLSMLAGGPAGLWSPKTPL